MNRRWGLGRLGLGGRGVEARCAFDYMMHRWGRDFGGLAADAVDFSGNIVGEKLGTGFFEIFRWRTTGILAADER